MEIKRKLLFFPEKEPNGKKNAKGEPVYHSDGKLRFRIRYERTNVVNFNVGYRVEHSKWSKDTQRCKVNTSHGAKKVAASEINKEIQRLEDLASSVFKHFEVRDQIPSTTEFKDEFNKANGKQTGTFKGDGFFDLWDRFVFLEGNKNNWTESTHKKFRAIKAHLMGYNPKLSLKTLDEGQLTGFVSYLGAKGLVNSSINKHYSFVRWFLRWAYNKDYYSGPLHTWKPGLKLKRRGQIKTYLEWDELMALNELVIPEQKQYLERVKDVFVFLCFTGLRYSDAAKLQKSEVSEGHIQVVTQKTADPLIIELNKYSRAILDKYKDVPFKNDLALPVISNQRMNEYLKELGELAGLDSPQKIVSFRGNQRIEEVQPKYSLLSTHCGRRTFVVSALSLGISPAVVMKWTGHSDYKSMEPYIDIVGKLKADSMNKFNVG